MFFFGFADRDRSERLKNVVSGEFGQADRIGAIIKAYGEPIRTRSYLKWFREIAEAAKIPDSVWSMDARAGAVTEALEAGAEKTDVQRAATHSSAAMTERYDRKSEAASLAVAGARRKARTGRE